MTIWSICWPTGAPCEPPRPADWARVQTELGACQDTSDPHELEGAPEEGIYIHGLFMASRLRLTGTDSSARFPKNMGRGGLFESQGSKRATPTISYHGILVNSSTRTYSISIYFYPQVMRLQGLQAPYLIILFVAHAF